MKNQNMFKNLTPQRNFSQYVNIPPDIILLENKLACISMVFILKLRELFKERYYLETKKHYKDNPLHGEFIIEMLGKDRFNKFRTDDQSDIKSGNSNRWSLHLLFIILSYPFKSVPIDKLNKENELIKKYKLLAEDDYSIIAYSYHQRLIEIKRITLELYKSLGGNESDVFEKVDKVVGGGNGSKRVIGNDHCKFKIDSNSNGNVTYIECVRLKELGDLNYYQGKYQASFDAYLKALTISDNDSFKNWLSFISTIYLNKSLAEFEMNPDIKKSEENGYASLNSPIAPVCIASFTAIERFIHFCRYSTELTPSWSRSWNELAYYTSRLGTSNDIGMACKYIEIASSLDPNNIEISKFKAQLNNDYTSVSKIEKLLKQVNELGKDQVFYKIAELYIDSNKKFEITSDFIKLYNDVMNNNKDNSIDLNNLKNSKVSLSHKFHDLGYIYHDEGEFENAFKCLCLSILVLENTDNCCGKGQHPWNCYHVSSIYFLLGKMYMDGNSFIKQDCNMAISLFYKSSIIGDFFKIPITIENQTGRIGSMYYLATIYYQGMDVYKCNEIAMYWFSRICSINKPHDKSTENMVYEFEDKVIIDSLYKYGKLLIKNDIKMKINGKESEGLKVLSKGYLNYGCLECLNAIEEFNKNQANILKSIKNHHSPKVQQVPPSNEVTIKNSIGKQIYEIESNNHFKRVDLDYINIKKFAQLPSQPSIQAQRIISVLDLVNLFINQFKSSRSLKEKEKSIQYLADAFMYKELYAIKLPIDLIEPLVSYITKSLSFAKNSYSKSLSIVWIGLNCFNIFVDVNETDQFEKRNSEMIEFIKKSINKFPKDSIFKFFSAIFNRYSGNLEIALDELNKCINNISNSTTSTKNNESSSDIYYYYKADTLFYLKRNQESIDCYNEYLNKSPIDGRWRMESYYTIAHLKHDPKKPIENDQNFKLAKESESKSLYCFLPWLSSKFY